MPAKMSRPMSKRLRAPAPAAMISGTMPTTIAAVVIRIGRSRTRGRMLDRLAPRHACSLLHPVGEVDHQDAVLGDQADQRHEPDLRCRC